MILRPPMFLESLILTSNLPKSLENVPSPELAKSSTGIGQMVYWFGPNPLPVLVKPYTCIGQIIYRYWPSHLPSIVLVKFQNCQHSKIVYQYWQNGLPVLSNSSTGIGQMVYRSSVLRCDFDRRRGYPRSPRLPAPLIAHLAG